MLDLFEQEIRETAYQLWESEGRPVDRAEEHWRRAVKLVKGLRLPILAMPVDPVPPRERNHDKVRLGWPLN